MQMVLCARNWECFGCCVAVLTMKSWNRKTVLFVVNMCKWRISMFFTRLDKMRWTTWLKNADKPEQQTHFGCKQTKREGNNNNKIYEMNQKVQNDKLLYFDRVVQSSVRVWTRNNTFALSLSYTYIPSNCLTIFKMLFWPCRLSWHSYCCCVHDIGSKRVFIFMPHSADASKNPSTTMRYIVYFIFLLRHLLGLFTCIQSYTCYLTLFWLLLFCEWARVRAIECK